MPLPPARPFPDVIELWPCPVCGREEVSLLALGRHMGKTGHGTIVVKNVGAERSTVVLTTPPPHDKRDGVSVLPLSQILRDVR